MIQIKTLLKPKTAEGKRIKPTSPLKPAFFEQTLDKYHFQNNEKYSNPPFFYRHYYENSNIKNSSGNSQKFDIARAITSQSTKNSSRANFENFVSFLQTTENNPNERIKTQQSTLFAACQRRSGQNINNEISEESIYKERINTANGNITKNNAIFYERKKNDNKFFLPKTSTFSKKLKYILNEELVNKGLGEEKLDKAQAKFLQKKYFGDSNPDKFYMEKMNNNYSRENIVSNKSHNHLNVMKKIILKENFITDFQNEEDPFQKNEACKKKFKINSIIMKNPKEISHATLINSQIKPKLFVQKNITKASENNRMFLIIENLYLDEGKKNKLKYCYSQLNYPKEIRTQKQINEEFDQIKSNFIDYFGINAKEIFIFLKNGNFVKNHYEIPITDVCLILSGSQRFNGIYNITNNKKRKINMLSVMAHLEFPVREFEKLNPKNFDSFKIYEETIKSNNSQLFENTLRKINSSGQYLDSKNLERIYRNLKCEKSLKNLEALEIFETIETNLPHQETNDYFDLKNQKKPLNTTKAFEEICEIYEVYNHNNNENFQNYEGNDEEDLQSPIKIRSNQIDLKDKSNLENIANHLDFLIEKWQKMIENQKISLNHISIKKYEKNPENEKSEKKELEYKGGIQIEEPKEKNIIARNVKQFMNKKQYMTILKKKNRELFLQNIPNLINQTHLSRKELHTIYILYKVLQQVTSQRYNDYNLDDGLDYYTFKNGIYQVFVQSEELAIRIFNTIDFNFSGFLNWEEFLNLMVIIRAKTLKEKIDLFIKIADEDGNGMLSKDEVSKLCKICLSKYIKEEGDSFLDDLCEYFTKLIFSSVQIDLSEEIPLRTIKSAIIQGTEESDLLAMFCGADI